ncbi:MAG: cell wall hydrolase [Candidatus Tectomicrobia bacterium]|nr:cell wall hydrolase [Candidatus Tectomicrobia bacterium]
MTSPFDRDDDATLLARLIWGEARGESMRGKLAVALSVINRVPPPGQHRWWGDSLREIMLKPAQYSCFNPKSSGFVLLVDPWLHDAELVWADCRDAASLVLAGEVRDFIGGATHYHAAGRRPKWARGREPTLRFGRHVFYAGVP